jgi:hypothetical protein
MFYRLFGISIYLLLLLLLSIAPTFLLSIACAHFTANVLYLCCLIPAPITGDFAEALRSCFTHRTLTGLVAGIFDPLGLATPITAGLKLDLHELCALKLDWDDPVPDLYLGKWAGTMEINQELKQVTFRRAVIPPDAANTNIHLLVFTDSSQNLGVVAIFGRVLRKCGRFSCQLLMGRSKLLSGLTIP